MKTGQVSVSDQPTNPQKDLFKQALPIPTTSLSYLSKPQKQYASRRSLEFFFLLGH